MYESEYDFDTDKTILRPVSKWEDVDIRESIVNPEIYGMGYLRKIRINY